MLNKWYIKIYFDIFKPVCSIKHYGNFYKHGKIFTNQEDWLSGAHCDLLLFEYTLPRYHDLY